MNPTKKLVRRSIATHPQSSEESKANSRFSLGMRSLPQINEVEPGSDPNKSMQARIQRKPSGESIAASPYATGKAHVIPRSMSVPKIKTKGLHGGKSGGLPKGRSSPRPESASNDPSFKKSKPPTWALDLDLSHKSPFLPKDSTLSSFSTPQNFSKTLPSKFTKVSKTRDRVGTPAASLPESQMSPSNLEEMENAMGKALQALQKTDFRGMMRVYHRYFSDVIRTSGALSSLLSKFKEGYEALTEELLEKYNREVAKFQSEIIALQNNILKEVEEKKSLMKKFEKLSRENIDLSHACENYEAKCNEYQEKLYDIANTKLDHYPPSQEAYRLLLSELDNYKGWKSKILRELRISQSKEKKLIQLVHALKKRGYPVEEVYNSEIRTPAATPKLSVSRASEEGESERLVSGPPKERKRPECVPGLNLETVEPDIDSDESEEDSSYQCTEMEFSLRKTLSDSSTHTRTEGAEHSDANSTGQDDLKKMSQEFKAFSAALRIGSSLVQ